MKKILGLIFILGLIMACSEQKSDEPWRKDQLMEPEVLAQKIKQNKTDNLLILSIGFDDPIKNSIDVGPANDEAGLEKLKNYLSDVPKDQDIVIYCGCCPMDKCPNIRPAFKTLNELGYTHAKLLEMPTSVKADWIDHNYPVKSE